MTLQQALDELQSLDPNNVGAWPTFAYVGACVLVLALLTVGGYYYLVTPNLEELERQRRTEVTLKQGRKS